MSRLGRGMRPLIQTALQVDINYTTFHRKSQIKMQRKSDRNRRKQSYNTVTFPVQFFSTYLTSLPVPI